MRIGTAEAQPGDLATGHIELGHYPDGPLVSPVMLARGAKPGPRLWVQCLIHGGEIGGPIALARFLRELDLTTLNGSIAGLMVANPFGFRTYNRLVPQDGMNLNRIFPGKPDGSVSEQIAHRLLALAGEHGDVMLDLHSGGELTITAFYVIYPKGPAAAEQESQRLSTCVGSRYQWGGDEDWLNGSAFINYTRRFGRPSLIVESGGGARVTDQDLANFRTAIEGLARGLGMLPGALPTVADVRHGGNAVHVKATVGGFWQSEVAPGDDMTSGQLMGRMLSITGEVVEEIRCPLPQAWVGSIRRPWMPIYAGDQVVEVVERLPG